MRLLLAAVATVFLAALPAQADPYLTLSFGTALEKHRFDIGPSTGGRRMPTGHDASSDQAIGLGWRDAFQLGGRRFDAELELFERRNNRFTATAPAGAHPTRIKTTSVMVAAWTDLATGDAWALQAGAGLGARQSSYRMTGPAVNLRATDHAPYVMLGLRYARRTSDRTTVFADLRAHARPPVSADAIGTATGKLEHEARGLTLRLGVQLDLARR